MSALNEFRCEICGTVTGTPIHWFVIQCGNSELTVLKWNVEAANAAKARHFCGVVGTICSSTFSNAL